MLANGFAPTDAGAQSIVSVFGWWHARCWVSPERWFGLTLHITLFGVGGSRRSPFESAAPGEGLEACGFVGIERRGLGS